MLFDKVMDSDEHTRPSKRSRRKQTFGTNDLPEIDDDNKIKGNVEMIDHIFGANDLSVIDEDHNEISANGEMIDHDEVVTTTKKTKSEIRKRKQTVGVNYLRKTDNNDLGENVEMISQSCETYQRKDPRKGGSDKLLHEDPKSLEVHHVKHSEKAVKSVPLFRTITKAQKTAFPKPQRRIENSFVSSESSQRLRLNEGLFTPEELVCLEKSGMPQPLSAEELASITKALNEEYHRYHSEMVVCAVCDELFCHSETELVSIADLPSSFFVVLQKPLTSSTGLPPLHSLLIQQYDVSQHFLADSRFRGLLLSPRGVQNHRKNCLVKSQNCCESRLFICLANGCLTALKNKRIPRFAIAHGNYIGQLPESMRELTFASRSLIRPVTSFGRMASYSDTSGTRLTGHIYSNRLNTALVRHKLPMCPAETAIRVLIVSPMSTDQSAVSRAKMASVKSDYIIQPQKISDSLRFFQEVGNKIMQNVCQKSIKIP